MKLTDQIRVKEAAPPSPPTPEAVAPPAAPKEPEPAVAINPIPPPPAPPEVAMVKAKACEEELTSLAAAGQILFAVGSADLESISFPTLDRLADAAKSCPGMAIEVGGHTSAEGGRDLNQQLSLKRAQSVVGYLVRAGVDATRLQPAGYGASRPVAPNSSDESMARNRRIEFTVRPK
jgi:outer membrane protein OmpA-like peptidoglycan-associated protein